MAQMLLTLNEKMENPNGMPKSLIFVDSDIEKYQKLIAGVAVDNEIKQIARIIKTRANLCRVSRVATLHIVSRESQGYLYLGNGRLNLDTIDCYAAPTANWKISSDSHARWRTTHHWNGKAADNNRSNLLNTTASKVQTANISPKGFYYWKGDFRRTGGTILGTLRLTLCADSSQIFQLGIDGITLWDLSNFCELTLNRDASLKGCFSNSGTSILAARDHLEQLATSLYQNFDTIAENSKIRHNAEVVFADNRGTAVSLSIYNDDLYVTLVNEERNLNGNAMETNRVTPKSTNALEERTLTMTQTDNSGAQFRASLPAVMGCAQLGDNVLEGNGTKDLKVSCSKSEDSAIANNGNLQTAEIVWNGGGADRYWSNPLNWSGDRVPTQGDRVIFDGTSTKNVILNICPQIKSLTISCDYKGTLSGWNDLMASENVLIQGGTINVNLEIDGDLAIENGTVNSYLCVGGHLAIRNGTIAWYGGKVAGDVSLSGGAVSFSSNYNSYYVLNGDFTRSGGTISGKPIFCFHGSSLQIFEPGSDGMTLRDLYNFSELILDGEVTLSGIFCNNGTFTVVNGATLDARKVNFFSNSGAIALHGTILQEERGARAETDNPVTSDTSDNSLYINSIQEDKNFDSLVAQTALVAVKSLSAMGEGTYAIGETDKVFPPFKGNLTAATAAANSGENLLDRESTEELKVKSTDDEDRADSKLHHFHTAAIV